MVEQLEPVPEAENHASRLTRPGQPTSRRLFLEAAALGGIAAGVVSTLVQIALWRLFTDAFPAILWRDARLTAALVLGPRILAPPTFDWPAMVVSSVIHFGLSIVYGAVMCAIVRPLAGRPATIAGALLGAALYVVNLHGFTMLFPWFEPARGWITVAAHVVFGVTAVGVSRLRTRTRA